MSNYVILDAGANIGNHTVFFALICGAQTVYAFEPMKETFKILQTNIHLNSLSNVRIWNSGLGATASRAQLKLYSNTNFGVAALESAEDGPYEIMPIDSLALKRLDFMKIDVEGFQEEVLKGARETLARCKPTIWIELRTVAGRYNEYQGGDALLRELGYKQLRALTARDFLYGSA